MKRYLACAAFSVLALCASGAQADEFDFLLAGSGLAQIDDPTGCTRYGCDDNVAATWDGSVRLVLDGTGDGVYGAADIASLAVQSNWQSYTWSNGDPSLFGENSVTVTNGAVTDLEFNWSVDPTHNESFQLTSELGDFIGAFANGLCSGCGRPDATGYNFVIARLTPVPEPSDAGLLLAGLGWLVATRRRASSRQSPAA